MKLSTGLLVAMFGASAVSATPYYVGENLKPQNNVTLGFSDAPTDSATTDSGNIAAIELEGAYKATDNVALKANLPFFTASKSATGTSSKSSMGNVALGLNYATTLSSTTDATNWGVAFTTDFYLPTARKNESGVVATAHSTTDYYRYSAKTTSVNPNLGIWAGRDQFTVKTNVGYGYQYVSGSGIGDRNRGQINWQTGATWHATQNLNASLEYNTIMLDSATAGTTKKYRHAVAPSISGNFDNIIASAFVNIPLDETTRDTSNKYGFGLNAGYTF